MLFELFKYMELPSASNPHTGSFQFERFLPSSVPTLMYLSVLKANFTFLTCQDQNFLLHVHITHRTGLTSLENICCCSVSKSCLTLHNPLDSSRSGFTVLYYHLQFAQTNVHWVGDAIQPSHPLLPSSPSAFSLSQPQGLFQWVGSSHQVVKVLELRLQRWFFQ